jgi:hypothetical protein
MQVFLSDSIFYGERSWVVSKNVYRSKQLFGQEDYGNPSRPGNFVLPKVTSSPYTVAEQYY